VFKLEICGIEDLVSFVSLIRGEQIDTELLKKLTKTVNESTDKLEEAISSQEEKNVESGS